MATATSPPSLGQLAIVVTVSRRRERLAKMIMRNLWSSSARLQALAARYRPHCEWHAATQRDVLEGKPTSPASASRFALGSDAAPSKHKHKHETPAPTRNHKHGAALRACPRRRVPRPRPPGTTPHPPNTSSETRDPESHAPTSSMHLTLPLPPTRTRTTLHPEPIPISARNDAATVTQCRAAAEPTQPAPDLLPPTPFCVCICCCCCPCIPSAFTFIPASAAIVLRAVLVPEVSLAESERIGGFLWCLWFRVEERREKEDVEETEKKETSEETATDVTLTGALNAT
ncbi:hypothetical protein B0H13DRAFT_2331717 [Mycena leptocephala]|nr:hypothetical protein B0H13DRAFT_2331717 [Mycena leptocephala]